MIPVPHPKKLADVLLCAEMLPRTMDAAIPGSNRVGRAPGSTVPVCLPAYPPRCMHLLWHTLELVLIFPIKSTTLRGLNSPHSTAGIVEFIANGLSSSTLSTQPQE